MFLMGQWAMRRGSSETHGLRYQAYYWETKRDCLVANLSNPWAHVCAEKFQTSGNSPARAELAIVYLKGRVVRDASTRCVAK